MSGFVFKWYHVVGWENDWFAASDEWREKNYGS